MKKIVIFLIVAMSSILTLQAQRNRTQMAVKMVSTGLNVEVRIDKSHIAIRELSDPIAMFTFKLFTPSFPLGSINPTLEPKQLTANCIYHEIGGFKVEYKNNVSINLNGDVVYNFVITGLSTEMLYAVDVIPNVNILTPNIGYVLTKSGHAQNGFCNNSTVNGQALKIKISAANPPK